MKEKNQQEMKAAERQVALLVSALDKAKENGGVWLNKEGLPRPKMYPNGVNVSPFNALVMALHTDASAYSTPLYITFNTAKDKNMAVMKGEQGVPFLWYNWDTFVNKEDPDEKISRSTYDALPESVKVRYKVLQKREVNTVFNIDQTTFPSIDKERYERLQQQYGNTAHREMDLKELKTQFGHFLLTIRENLVPVKHKNQLAKAIYDVDKDTVYIPNQKNYSSYADFAQDATRQIMLATGHNERLARVSAPTEDAQKQEALISELATGIKMSELGLPAILSKENMEYIDHWKQELQANPCLIDIVERDVNTALDLLGKAERGEKIEYLSKVRKAETEANVKPDVNSEECAALLDIIRHEGREVDKRNFSSQKKYREFMEKFELTSLETDKQLALAEMKNPKVTEEIYGQAEAKFNTLAENISMSCRASLPKTWNDKSNHFYVVKNMSKYITQESNLLLIVKDKRSKITDVVLPTGTSISPKVATGSYIKRIENAVKKDYNSSYIRFFNITGIFGYRPDDTYFQGKTLDFCELKNWKLYQVASMQPYDAIMKAETVIFDRIAILKDDKDMWSIYMKPHYEPGFAIHPFSKDLNQFFATLKHGSSEKIETLKNELAQSYYAFSQSNPELKFDIFAMDIPQEDIDRIGRVNIFKTKAGKLYLSPEIEGIDKQQPREITKQQWQRAWLADDLDVYKKQLASKIYADVLHPIVQLEEGESITSGITSQEDDKFQEEQREVAEPHAGIEIPKETPIDLTTFNNLKEKHPDALLLFRNNDNYQAYKQDAVICCNVLGLERLKAPLVDSEERVSTVSFSTHKLDEYLPKLIRAGNRIAICDSELPRQEKHEQETQENDNTQSHGLRR